MEKQSGPAHRQRPLPATREGISLIPAPAELPNKYSRVMTLANARWTRRANVNAQKCEK